MDRAARPVFASGFRIWNQIASDPLSERDTFPKSLASLA
jgi:hypothetical protein